MDNIDNKILKILSQNSEIETTKISKMINLSVPAVNKRIKKLKDEGVIKNFTILTDCEKVNKPILAFILVALQYKQGIDDFLQFVDNEQDIMECYAISGGYDYILKICAGDIKSLEQKLLQIKGQNGVVKSQTMLVLMEQKVQPTVLPDDLEDI